MHPFRLSLLELPIDGINQLTADARDLHLNLRTGQPFRLWWDNIESQLQLVYGEHYGFYSLGLKHKRVSYRLTLGTVHEIVAITDTERAQMVRLYVVAKEREWLAEKNRKDAQREGEGGCNCHGKMR